MKLEAYIFFKGMSKTTHLKCKVNSSDINSKHKKAKSCSNYYAKRQIKRKTWSSLQIINISNEI